MSKKKVILADHTKFGQESVMSVVTSGEIGSIMTDSLLNKTLTRLRMLITKAPWPDIAKLAFPLQTKVLLESLFGCFHAPLQLSPQIASGGRHTSAGAAD